MGPEDGEVLYNLSISELEFSQGVCIDAGSRNMNGTVKSFLGPGVQFIGIDEFEPDDAADRGITWQGFVHDYPGEEVATLVTCFNSFEHDFHWRETTIRLIELLKPGGLFVFQLVCSGVIHGADNPTEPYGTKMEDGEYYYKNVDDDQFIRLLDTLSVVVHQLIRRNPGETGTSSVDTYNRPSSQRYEITRHITYIIGRKNVGE